MICLHLDRYMACRGLSLCVFLGFVVSAQGLVDKGMAQGMTCSSGLLPQEAAWKIASRVGYSHMMNCFTTLLRCLGPPIKILIPQSPDKSSKTTEKLQNFRGCPGEVGDGWAMLARKSGLRDLGLRV